MQKAKVVLAGHSSAGKTSLLIRIAENEFVSDTVPTLTAAYLSKYLEY